MNPTETPPPARVRKPYKAPKLVYLGSIGQCTLGTATIGPPDAKATGGRRGG